MDSIRKEFEKRKTESQIYLNYIERINNPEEISDVYKMLKANYYLIIYNLVESTITSSLTKLKDILSSKQVKFTQLNSSLQQKYLKYHCKELNKATTEENRIKKLNYLVDIFTEIKHIDYEFIGFVNGNVDAKKINELCNDIGLNFVSENKDKAFISMQTLLLARDILSHGNIGFVDYGKDKTIQDLKNLDNIILYVEDFVTTFEQYLKNEKYCNL